MKSNDIQTGEEYWCKSLKKRVTVVAYTQGDIYAVVYDGQEDIPVLVINLESLEWDGGKSIQLKNYPSGDPEFDQWFRETQPDWADEIDEQLETKNLLNRFTQAYDFLVEQTDNRDILFHQEKNQRLKDLLELFEYLRGEDEENPLTSWFGASQ